MTLFALWLMQAAAAAAEQPLTTVAITLSGASLGGIIVQLVAGLRKFGALEAGQASANARLERIERVLDSKLTGSL